MNKPDFFENYFVWVHPARQSSVSIRLENEDSLAKESYRIVDCCTRGRRLTVVLVRRIIPRMDRPEEDVLNALQR